MKIKIEEDIKFKAELQEELNNHHNAADAASQEKKIDKIMAQNDPTVKCFTFNLQQCLATPDIYTSVAFYKRLLDLQSYCNRLGLKNVYLLCMA